MQPWAAPPDPETPGPQHRVGAGAWRLSQPPQSPGQHFTPRNRNQTSLNKESLTGSWPQLASRTLAVLPCPRRLLLLPPGCHLASAGGQAGTRPGKASILMNYSRAEKTPPVSPQLPGDFSGGLCADGLAVRPPPRGHPGVVPRSVVGAVGPGRTPLRVDLPASCCLQSLGCGQGLGGLGGPRCIHLSGGLSPPALMCRHLPDGTCPTHGGRCPRMRTARS